MSTNTKEEGRFEQLRQWLLDNQNVVAEPREVTLYDFNIDWSRWSGDFKVRFDEFVIEESFKLSIGLNGFPKFHAPAFHSPLGAPATYPATLISTKTKDAILAALKRTFPKLKPLGRNRETGIKIYHGAPIEARLPSHEIEATKSLVVKGYSISMRLKDL